MRLGLMTELLSELQSDIVVLHQLAQMSYQHELGFTKLTLGEFPDLQIKVRLHVWCQSKMPDEANVHNHRFKGHSFVVYGQLENTRWSAQPCPDGAYQHYRYDSRLDSPEYTLKYIENADLERTNVLSVNHGETYGFSSEELHTTEVVSDTLLTLFVEDRSSMRPHADVYAHHYPASHHRIAAPPLTQIDFLSLLAATRSYFT